MVNNFLKLDFNYYYWNEITDFVKYNSCVLSLIREIIEVFFYKQSFLIYFKDIRNYWKRNSAEDFFFTFKFKFNRVRIQVVRRCTVPVYELLSRVYSRDLIR